MKLFIHTGVRDLETKYEKQKTVVALIRKDKKTKFIWLPIDLRFMKIIEF